ncbi:MAG: HlyD family secretion protein [Vicinamibacterales bacterium]
MNDRYLVTSFMGTALLAVLAGGCREQAPEASVRASGHVEATEVQVAAKVGGRLLELRVSEGTRVSAGDVIGRIETVDIELALRRARAEGDGAKAQLRLLLAGARVEDIRQAEAQASAARAELAAAEAELSAARADFERFETLLRSNSGSEKQRDDAATRRDVAEQRVAAARERTRAADESLARLRSGARREEIDAARARVAAADAQVATLEQNLSDATVTAPVAGIVCAKLAEAGEILGPRSPLVVIMDLDHAWANIYVDEPVVPRIRLSQQATIITDAGGRLPGRVTFISPKAEFTPRNVQTAEERSKLVYRVKVAADNREGILKQGMPVEAEIPLQ